MCRGDGHDIIEVGNTCWNDLQHQVRFSYLVRGVERRKEKRKRWGGGYWRKRREGLRKLPVGLFLTSVIYQTDRDRAHGESRWQQVQENLCVLWESIRLQGTFQRGRP